LGAAHIDQWASSVDAATMPWGKGFVGAGVNLLQWDPSIYTDYSAGSGVAYTCSVETQMTTGGVPDVQKQLTEVQVEGQGTWEVILKYRQTAGSAWTSLSLGSVVAPGKLYPTLANMPIYRERVVRLKADSASTLRFRSIGLVEDVVGVPG